jgi:enolase-phosphatase E1
VSLALRARGVEAVVLDIEGTTTPLSFVHDVLFPYARAHLEAFVADPAHDDVVTDVSARLEHEHAAEVDLTAPAWHASTAEARRSSVIAYAVFLMACDRKSPALKTLQGHIWAEGYRRGALRGVVYDDVPPALERWHSAGITLAIYSSGSVQAQQLIFSTTAAGDLTKYFSHYFDTAVGPKRSPDSYTHIATALGIAPSRILFVSDLAEELAAARLAGLQVVIAVRSDLSAPRGLGADQIIRTFADLG